MTVETKLAELRMQERELLRTPCARCGHGFAAHSSWRRPCFGRWNEPPCRCKGFSETTDEQLVLK